MPRIFSSPVFWLQILVLPVLCLLRDVGYKYAKRMYRPQNYHHIQEIQKYNIQDYRPRYALPLLSALALRRFANNICHQDGAIPKGNSQGTPGTTHAQAERVRLLAGGRVADTRAPGVRHDAEQRKVRRNGLVEAALESGNDRDGRARRRRRRRRQRERGKDKVASNEINHPPSSSSLCRICYNAHCTMMMRRCPTMHGREFQNYDKTKQANIYTTKETCTRGTRLFMGAAKPGGQVGDWLGLDGDVVRRCTYPLATLPTGTFLTFLPLVLAFSLLVPLRGALSFFFLFPHGSSRSTRGKCENPSFFCRHFVACVCCAWVLMVCYGWWEGGVAPGGGG